MEGKIWFYRFQSKRISMPCIITTKHVISCSGSVRDELRCNRWIAFNDLLREKRHLLTRIESHKKDLKRPRTKWRKASESACPTNALGSIVSLLSLLKILFNNMFGRHLHSRQKENISSESKLAENKISPKTTITKFTIKVFVPTINNKESIENEASNVTIRPHRIAVNSNKNLYIYHISICFYYCQNCTAVVSLIPHRSIRCYYSDPDLELTNITG
ncbi:hypothetical protein YC2023_118978 [Brassica napus]